ncbi:hypothetical protein QR680_011900 [Steinernema hermaphroditum]|uniref:RRM domain-containing protein n=1 Tax=Steinernema hermaphroditum TaxID=289476 RepID=A0AA39I1Z1_9BILA|nr:hypothetical protein QR680_011900 [Steinernema hermaphroditum]
MARRAGPPSIDGLYSLKVDNISYHTTSHDLRRMFDRYGEIGDIHIPRDRHTRTSRGFAFVRFYNRKDAEYAMHKNDGRLVDGREIRVSMARYERPIDERGGRRERDDRHDDRRRSDRYDDRRDRERRERNRSRSRSRSRSPVRRSRSPIRERSRSRSPTPVKEQVEQARSRSRSASPAASGGSPQREGSAPVEDNGDRQSRSPSHMSLSGFPVPDEIIVNLFDYIDFTTCHTLFGPVCKRFRQLSSRYGPKQHFALCLENGLAFTLKRIKADNESIFGVIEDVPECKRKKLPDIDKLLSTMPLFCQFRSMHLEYNPHDLLNTMDDVFIENLKGLKDSYPYLFDVKKISFRSFCNLAECLEVLGIIEKFVERDSTIVDITVNLGAANDRVLDSAMDHGYYLKRWRKELLNSACLASYLDEMLARKDRV